MAENMDIMNNLGSFAAFKKTSVYIEKSAFAWIFGAQLFDYS